MNADEIKTLAASVGLSGDPLNVSVAIALAESGGNPTIVGDTTLPHASYGLWQINAIHDSEPAIAALGGAEAAVDPVKCGKMMMIVSKNGTDWEPWSTFKNGAYLSHLDAAKAAHPLTQPAPSPQVAPTIAAAPLQPQLGIGIAAYVAMLRQLADKLEALIS